MIATIVLGAAKLFGRRFIWTRTQHNYREKWKTSRLYPDRVCPDCRGMDGVTRDPSEPWPNGMPDPPVHPICRCEIEIVLL